MTTFDRFDPFERRIGEAIHEIAAPRTPDYLTDVLRQTARTVQRPRWSFPERWLPVDTTLARPMLFGRLPLRQLIVLAVLVALATAAAIWIVGHQPPAPILPRVYANQLIPGPDLLAPRGNETTTVGLRDGRVLIIGGDPEGSVEVFDPIRGESQRAAAPSVRGDLYQAAVLGDSSVLVLAFSNASGPSTALDAQRFLPDSLTFETVGSTITPRLGPSLVALRDGRILVTGGSISGVDLGSAELFDPETHAFAPTGSAAPIRMRSAGVLLPDGRVLFVAVDGVPFGSVAGMDARMVAEIYDPTTDRFSDASTGRGPGGIPVLLHDGRVLIAGGVAGGIERSPASWVWDGNGFERISDPPFLARTATTLDDGRILITGAIRNEGTRLATYEPASGNWTEHQRARAFTPAVVKLPDGRVLLVGGLADGEIHDVAGGGHDAPPVATMEYFQ